MHSAYLHTKFEVRREGMSAFHGTLYQNITVIHLEFIVLDRRPTHSKMKPNTEILLLPLVSQWLSDNPYQPEGLLCWDTELSQPTKQPTHNCTSSTSNITAGPGQAFGLEAGSPAASGRAGSKERDGRTASSGGCYPSPRQLLTGHRGPTGPGPGTLNSSHWQGTSWRQQCTEK